MLIVVRKPYTRGVISACLQSTYKSFDPIITHPICPFSECAMCVVWHRGHVVGVWPTTCWLVGQLSWRHFILLMSSYYMVWPRDHESWNVLRIFPANFSTCLFAKAGRALAKYTMDSGFSVLGLLLHSEGAKNHITLRFRKHLMQLGQCLKSLWLAKVEVKQCRLQRVHVHTFLEKAFLSYSLSWRV